MKFSAILTVSSAFLAMVVAQGSVSVTTPLPGTKYKAGTEVIIRWTDPKTTTISQIALARGKATALNVLSIIGKDINAKDMQYSWTIPYEIENGDDYALEFGTSPDISFAGPFSIEGGVGIVPTANASVPASPAAPVSPAPVDPAAPAQGVSSPAAPAPAPVSSSSPSSTTAGVSHSSNMPAASNSMHASAGVKELPSGIVLGFGIAAYAVSQLF
ncbi:hypothetical protein K501DRAFT_300636 [Backusella circina FSU 941]|nr:hypothetical protein K501DRAFT_300636 [Backusella circina FSU 941]